jgi:hypothetical protein
MIWRGSCSREPKPKKKRLENLSWRIWTAMASKKLSVFFDGGIAIHSSVDGRQLAWGPWPESGPYDRNRTRAIITRLYPADLHGTRMRC